MEKTDKKREAVWKADEWAHVSVNVREKKKRGNIRCPFICLSVGSSRLQMYVMA
jgi:hypothetical protein